MSALLWSFVPAWCLSRLEPVTLPVEVSLKESARKGTGNISQFLHVKKLFPQYPSFTKRTFRSVKVQSSVTMSGPLFLRLLAWGSLDSRCCRCQCNLNFPNSAKVWSIFKPTQMSAFVLLILLKKKNTAKMTNLRHSLSQPKKKSNYEKKT